MALKFSRREGEVAVITGGAGGIGAACATAWIAHGGIVVVCDIVSSFCNIKLAN
jgi:NAD(P)-dependent dehydrogenase (short-subunit alcohol dehydrogenase family)